MYARRSLSNARCRRGAVEAVFQVDCPGFFMGELGGLNPTPEKRRHESD